MDYRHIVKALREEINKYQRERERIEPDSYLERLIFHLRNKFSGIDIDQLLRGRNEYNPQGRFYVIEEELDHQLVRFDLECITSRLDANLSFLPGIREKTATVLNRRGYTTIRDLISHPRFGLRAQKVCRLLEKGNVEELLSLCCMRYPKSSPLFLLVSQLFNLQEFVFLDLESLGLFSGNMVFLIGMIKFNPQGARLTQILARFPEEEPALLWEAIRLLAGIKVMVSYNGKAFDYPYLEHRAAIYGLEFEKPLLHLDLLHFSRRIFKHLLEEFKLGNIEEKVLNKKREEDVKSEYVPLLYQRYLKERDPAYLYPIILHNRNDLITLVELLNLLYTKCL